MNTNDILSVYHHEDTKNHDLTQRYLSISPPKKGDGAIHTSVHKDSAELDANTDRMFRGIHSHSTDNLSSLESKRRINLYREILKYPEVDNVVNQIVADAIVFDEKKRFVHIDLDGTNFKPRIKDLIIEEFENVLKLYQSKKNAMRFFKKYYVDSKIFFHKVIDPNNPSKGILELREIDPRIINLHRRSIYQSDENGEDVWVGYEDYFLMEDIYINNQTGFDFNYSTYAGGSKLKYIPRSAITYAHSGLLDCNDQIIGHLHQAIKPAHTLKMLEDAMVIYRVTRAPDRKIFYIDTGKLTPHQAREMMDRIRREHSNKTVYDVETGKFDSYKNQLLVTDDYWLQRQDGKATAEIDTLPGASGMNEIEDIKWQNKKLFEALKVPLSRMPNENVVMFGDDGGTSRDERNFQKFIKQTRENFAEIFYDPLMTNLILKNIITEEEWLDNVENIIFKFNNDEYYTEIADLEIKERRVDLLERFDKFRGKYISGKAILRDILQYTDDDIEEMRAEIEEEMDDVLFNPPINVDQYGKVITPEETGTLSTDVEQVIPDMEVDQSQFYESVDQEIKFNIYK